MWQVHIDSFAFFSKFLLFQHVTAHPVVQRKLLTFNTLRLLSRFQHLSSLHRAWGQCA